MNSRVFFWCFLCWNHLRLWSLSSNAYFLWASHGSNKPNLAAPGLRYPELLRIHDFFSNQFHSMHPERFRFTFHLIPPAKKKGATKNGTKLQMTFFLALKQEKTFALSTNRGSNSISMMNQVRNWPWWDVDGLAVKWFSKKNQNGSTKDPCSKLFDEDCFSQGFFVCYEVQASDDPLVLQVKIITDLEMCT